MKKILFILLALAQTSSWSFGQGLTQTVRGQVTDIDSELPLIGVTVIVQGTDPIIGTVTGPDGNFRLDKVPAGRANLRFTYMGYETKTIPNLTVNSGKETIINIQLQESAVSLDEVVVRPYKNKGEALNDMAVVSSRSISVEETKRFAGGFDDPSRVVSNFAGVTNTPDGSSDIIVRGNSPKYIQWRLDGAEISNPYHFNDQNSSMGGLSALNNNLLAASDFYTAAFSPEYGNVLSSIMDINLRAGNNEKYETTLGLGLIGTDMTFEGPFRKGYGGSFLVNYRYSTSAVIQQLGLVDIEGVPKFQDLNAKAVLPTKDAGTFSLFVLGGLNGISLEDLTPKIMGTPGNKTRTLGTREEIDKHNYLINVGLGHTMPINKNSYIKTSLGYSGTGISDELFKSNIVPGEPDQNGETKDIVTDRWMIYNNHIVKSVYRGTMTYNNKINAKNKIQIGTNYAIHDLDINQDLSKDGSDSLQNLVDLDENIGVLRNFISWRWLMNDKLTLVAGAHNTNVLFSNESTIEPRVALNWNINSKNSINLGYGNHSMMESVHHYFTKTRQEDGAYRQSNKDLEMLRAHHFVLGYEKRFTDFLRARAEVYYQGLYNLPVENVDTSYFCTINEGMDYRYVDLVNQGTGKNYGVELTLERFFHNNIYFLVNTSIYNSTYKSLEGVDRNTRYNKNYLANILVGKEFPGLGKKNNQTLSINLKMFFEGAQKILPLLKDENGNLAVDPESDRYWDYGKAYEEGLDKIYQVNLSASYKFNRKKATHEIFLDLQNLTNTTGRIYEYFDETEPGSVGYVEQFVMFPNLMYRVYF